MKTRRALTVLGRVWMPGPGRIRLGYGVTLVGYPVAIELRAHAGAEIFIDDGAVIESGASIEATCSVLIGRGARVGPMAKVMDNHFHHATGDRLARPQGVPVVVGPHSVIGPYAIVLPGASLGVGSRLQPRGVLSFHLPGALP